MSAWHWRPARRAFRRPAFACAIVTVLTIGAGVAVADAPQPVLPEQLQWASPPNNPAVRGAWVVGAERDAGPYLFRVQLAAGARVPPHTHPDARSSTVLAGTLFVGFGKTFDATKVVAVPVGGVYVAPAGVPHYVWAKDGEVVYQESGTGPTAVAPVSP